MMASLPIVYGYIIYCLTCSGVNQLEHADHHYRTMEACERAASARIQQAFPPGHRYDIQCMRHALQPSESGVRIED